MRKTLIGFMVVLVVTVAVYLRVRTPSGPREVAYAGSREVTLWSTTAQVREPVATVKYGERLDVLGRSEDQVRVRTTSGSIGWTSGGDLLSADLWQRANDLQAVVASRPVEARGHTRAISNLHVEAGRDSPRIGQLARGIPVDLFERKVADVPTAGAAAAVAEKNAASAPTPEGTEVRKEDWWLVRAHLPDRSLVAGWILARFIDLDVPAPLPDYASAAAMHVVAWFELNHVTDRSGELKPQYLLVGNRGAEGQRCDFTMMRVFTWGKQRERYETAYVESDLCGRLPVNLAESAAPGAGALFSFEDLGNGAPEERRYRMENTMVRRLTEGGSEPLRRKHARG
jgi:hypothetical protein